MLRILATAEIFIALLLIGLAFGGGFLAIMFSGMAGPDSNNAILFLFLTVLFVTISSIYTIFKLLKLIRGSEMFDETRVFLIGALLIVNVIVVFIPLFPAGPQHSSMSLFELFRSSTGL